jgi:hypothetical protein
MCILPNFEASDLEVLRRNGKKGIKTVEDETVEIIVTDQPLETLI